MAPFRASRSTRSGRPGGPSDHDIFDGLPVRQWKLQESILGPGDELNGDATKSAGSLNGWPELPMPKGSEQYPPWSLQLLRTARSGKVLTAQDGAASHDPDKENGVEEGRVEEAQRGTKRAAQNGFVATKWAQVPKHLEGPEREYVAKRRKGLQSSIPGRNGTSASASADISQMRKTKVQRPDEEGQPQVLEVMVPEGQTVEGEIREEVTSDIATGPITTPAPGTVVQGLGVTNEDGVVVATEGIVPLKKRHGPIRRKKKNKGRTNISSTEGQGVSASAEAFNEQLKAAAQQANDAAGQKDTVMSGTNEADEEEDEEGSDEEDEEGDDEEGDTAHEDVEMTHAPKVEEKEEEEDFVFVEKPVDYSPKADESEAPPRPSTPPLPEATNEQQTLEQVEIPAHTEEQPLQPTIDEPQEHIEQEVHERIDDDVSEPLISEVPEIQPIEPPIEVKEETVDEEIAEENPVEERKAEDIVEEKAVEENDGEGERLETNDLKEPFEDRKQDLESYNQPPSNPEETYDALPENATPIEQEYEPVEAPNDLKVESVEEAPPLQQPEEPEEPDEPEEFDEANDDSSEGPARPSPEPISPYSLSPVSKAHKSPGPENGEQVSVEQIKATDSSFSTNDRDTLQDAEATGQKTPIPDTEISNPTAARNDTETLETPHGDMPSSTAPQESVAMDVDAEKDAKPILPNQPQGDKYPPEDAHTPDELGM